MKTINDLVKVFFFPNFTTIAIFFFCFFPVVVIVGQCVALSGTFRCGKWKAAQLFLLFRCVLFFASWNESSSSQFVMQLQHFISQLVVHCQLNSARTYERHFHAHSKKKKRKPRRAPRKKLTTFSLARVGHFTLRKDPSSDARPLW